MIVIIRWLYTETCLIKQLVNVVNLVLVNYPTSVALYQINQIFVNKYFYSSWRKKLQFQNWTNLSLIINYGLVKFVTFHD